VQFFYFYSLLIFDLAKQQSLESVEEDRVNKPWRPIPSGQITSEQTREAILYTAPSFFFLIQLYVGKTKRGIVGSSSQLLL